MSWKDTCWELGWHCGSNEILCVVFRRVQFSRQLRLQVPPSALELIEKVSLKRKFEHLISFLFPL